MTEPLDQQLDKLEQFIIEQKEENDRLKQENKDLVEMVSEAESEKETVEGRIAKMFDRLDSVVRDAGQDQDEEGDADDNQEENGTDVDAEAKK